MGVGSFGDWLRWISPQERSGDPPPNGDGVEWDAALLPDTALNHKGGGWQVVRGYVDGRRSCGRSGTAGSQVGPLEMVRQHDSAEDGDLRTEH
jgi:hypothetical protein